MKIWKYELQITDTQVIEVPLGTTILSVANQRETLCLWVSVPQSLAFGAEKRIIEIVGTGNPFKECHRHFIGTVIMEPFVWHVFERLQP